MTRRVMPSPATGAFCCAIADPLRKSASPTPKTRITFSMCMLRSGQVTQPTFTPNARHEQYLPAARAWLFRAICLLPIVRIPADRSAGLGVAHAMPELSIGHFAGVSDAGQGKHIVVGFGVRDRNFHTSSFAILPMADESESAFGDIFTGDDVFQSRIPNAGGHFHLGPPILTPFIRL